jgi:integrin beta 6/protocadherin alpha
MPMTVPEQPFSYAHNLNLTNNATSFSDGFNSLEISTNTDNPEGTFDAILQAALCDKVVGWRENARKILLVLTDDSVHTAGDGKLAGLVKPVPGVCNTVYNPVKQRYEYSADDSYVCMNNIITTNAPNYSTGFPLSRTATQSVYR